MAKEDGTAHKTVDVVTPAAGESVTEGTILEWHVKVGDFIKADDTIVEISTDKIDVELPSPASGTVAEILIEEGDTVTVGQVIARISAGEPGDGRPDAPSGDGAATDAPPVSPARAQAAPPVRGPGPAPPQADGTGQAREGTRISPVAARAAQVEGVDLEVVSGTGPAGRIVKSDVLAAAGWTADVDTEAAAPAAPAPAAPTPAARADGKLATAPDPSPHLMPRAAPPPARV